MSVSTEDVTDSGDLFRIGAFRAHLSYTEDGPGANGPWLQGSGHEDIDPGYATQKFGTFLHADSDEKGQLSLRPTFDRSTLAQDVADGLLPGFVAELRAAVVDGGGDVEAPLSPAREGLWFLAQADPGADAAHVVPWRRLVRGVFDPASVEPALTAVIDRHELLAAAKEHRSFALWAVALSIVLRRGWVGLG